MSEQKKQTAGDLVFANKDNINSESKVFFVQDPSMVIFKGEI